MVRAGLKNNLSVHLYFGFIAPILKHDCRARSLAVKLMLEDTACHCCVHKYHRMEKHHLSVASAVWWTAS